MKGVYEKYKNECDLFQQQEEEKSKLIINHEKLKAQEFMDFQITQALDAAKNSLDDLRSNLVDKIFRDVMGEIRVYMESDQYKEKLLRDIKALSNEYSDNIIVYLCLRDMVFEDELNNIPNVTVVCEENDFIGGYKAKIQNKNIIVDKSFKFRLDDIKEKFDEFKIS